MPRDYVRLFPLPKAQPCLGLPLRCHMWRYFFSPYKAQAGGSGGLSYRLHHHCSLSGGAWILHRNGSFMVKITQGAFPEGSVSCCFKPLLFSPAQLFHSAEIVPLYKKENLSCSFTLLSPFTCTPLPCHLPANSYPGLGGPHSL